MSKKEITMKEHLTRIRRARWLAQSAIDRALWGKSMAAKKKAKKLISSGDQAEHPLVDVPPTSSHLASNSPSVPKPKDASSENVPPSES